MCPAVIVHEALFADEMLMTFLLSSMACCHLRTIGKMCYMLLHDQKFLGQILPRIPVLVMRDLEQKLEPYADAGRAKMGQRDHFRYTIN